MGRYSDLTWHGALIAEEAREHAEDGMDDGLELLLAASRAVVPLLSEDLSKSGKASRDGLEGTVSYNTVYARRQHEELTWRHAPGRQAKYLEQPFNELQSQMVQAIAVRLRAYLAS
ncbi:hypothetical protein ACWERV_17045 [Streptomyces sp. NPDC004031]